jgi:hypothetical protein
MRLLVLAAVLVSSAYFMQSCKTKSKEEALAKRVCSSCHAYTDPRMLDKHTWESSVLPEMRFRMGFESNRLWNYSTEDLKLVSGTIPKRPMVTEEEWNLIKQFFITNAPDSLEPSKEYSAQFDSLNQFEVATYPIRTTHSQFLTLIQYDSVTKSILVGSRYSKLLRLSADELSVVDSASLESAPSQVLRSSDGTMYVLGMGIMDPNDQRKGKVYQLDFDTDSLATVIDSLKRPVHMNEVDLNNDGQKDLLISCFGNVTGELLAFERKGDTYIQHFVHNFPGTRRTMIRDINNDGYMDIICLVTQGDERIIAFMNRGEFTFYQRQLLRFPPVYGSSYFDLVDLNGDNFEDILYTNGDNADYSPIAKPYHGIWLFYNDGDYNFEKEWDFPISGPSKAIAKDFDQDGDTDIAAISFFPDFQESPERGFVYLENTPDGYKAKVHSAAAKGRWIAMDVADIDDDGDLDILLASLVFDPLVPKPLFNKWTSENVSVLVLKNSLTR